MKMTTVSPSECSYTYGYRCHGVYQLFKVHNHVFYCCKKTHSSVYAYAIDGFPHTTEDYGKMTNRDAHTNKHTRTHARTRTQIHPLHLFTHLHFSTLNSIKPQKVNYTFSYTA